MIRFVYVERAARGLQRTEAILARLPDAQVLEIDRYQEVFNRRGQSFRLQKSQPCLILACKDEGQVLEAPAGYGLGHARNYYFSHMLNCLYDCRYCFLQGMYRSAHMVVFVNYEAFLDAIEARAAEALSGEETWFFSGYDCDSLAFEGITGFAEFFVPRVERLAGAHLELRTKSARVQPLTDLEPHPRCVVAYSLSPDETARAVEHGAPTLRRRLEAAARLQEQGWPIGLRFDPLLYSADFEERYRRLFEEVFDALPADRVHSVSLGNFRLPQPFFRNLRREYPLEPLLAGPLEKGEGGLVSYERALGEQLFGRCEELLLEHVGRDVYHPCFS